ncbi:MAG: LmbE family protein [Chloroflexi bacterium]|nr:LmbE family protein [Chloroflexota bacterium]
MAIGAHPDDCDIGAGGVAALYARAGHQVDFVSVTNGDAGHHHIGGAPLARQRQGEAHAAARVAGIRYTVLDNHDGELEPTLANRRQIIRLIRETRPDVIFTHRPNDYHPDHRATAQLVQDAAYTVTVPGSVALSPHLSSNPPVLFMSDRFQRPYPFTPDTAIAIDDAIDIKMAMLFEHTSQVFEWLPYNQGILHEVPEGEQERRAWLHQHYAARDIDVADRYRELLERLYGEEAAHGICHVEAFETSEHGGQLTSESRRRLFPFLPDLA